MAEPTSFTDFPTDTNSQNLTAQNLPTRTDINPPVVTYKDIRATFTRFFSEYSQIKPSDAPGLLLHLLMEQIKHPLSHVSHETQIQIQEDSLPGNATSLTIKPSEESSNEPEKPLPKDKKEAKHQQELKELKESKEKLKNEIKELKKKQQEDENEIKNLKKKRQEDENEIKNLKKKRQDDEVERNQLMNDLVNQINLEKNEKLRFNQECNRLEEQLKSKRKEYSDLYKKNEELRQEASEYQSALGDAKNYRLSDNDVNNPTQLTKDIGIIQDKLNDLCKLKGSGIEINEQRLVELLKSYNCTYESGDKVLLKAALQRRIVEVIINRTKEYFNKKLQHEVTELDYELYIYTSTEDYLSRLTRFINSRNGTDEVSFAAPIKIRKLVYAVFGDRGFGISNDKKEHEFIQLLKAEIIDVMDKFRTIKKADKKKDNEDMIAGIIRNVIKMFIFRIKVLEPPGEIDWIERGSKIDPTTMEVGNLEDDNHDDLIVNLCSFPLIGVNLKSTTDRKVLVPAKITTIKVEQKSSLFKKLIRSQTETTEQPQKRKHSSHSSDTNNKNVQPRNSSDPKLKPPTPPQKF